MAEKQKVYIDEDVGDDGQADGSEPKPYKTLLQAHINHPPEESEYLTRKSQTGPISEGGDGSERLQWKPASKSALKKAATLLQSHKKKQAKGDQVAIREKEEAQKRAKLLEEAKNVVISPDPALPAPRSIFLDEKDITLKQGDTSGTRVRVRGRVHRLRGQKDRVFITLQDGYGFLQCILEGKLTHTYDAMTLTLQTSMEIYGEMWEVPAKQHAPDNRELHADYFKVIGKAVGDKDAITNKVSHDADPSTLLNNRHLTLRGETASAVMKVRAAVLRAFRKSYDEIRPRCIEVQTPLLVQTSVEGGSTLFNFDYYGEVAYLTQSSQLYLETCVPSLGNVFTIAPSFRAEKSLTRRHLSEFTHIEAELDFITFDDLLQHLEEMMCRVIETTLADPDIAALIAELNPSFKAPERPFLRMKYADAIDWLVKHEIPNEEEKPHKFGDDIAEAAERKMTDEIGRPIFLTHFPADLKSFYMQKDPSDPRLTESVDCLMPGVGEIVGGSMRTFDLEELLEGFKRHGISPDSYGWYIDQRRYGTSPHGGYGLGLERFLAWICGRWTVRECCLYPRFMGRCTP